jgi:hypothetical protein
MSQLVTVTLHVDENSRVSAAVLTNSASGEPFAMIGITGAGSDVSLLVPLERREELRKLGTEALRFAFQLDAFAESKEKERREKEGA